MCWCFIKSWIWSSQCRPPPAEWIRCSVIMCLLQSGSWSWMWKFHQIPHRNVSVRISVISMRPYPQVFCCPVLVHRLFHPAKNTNNKETLTNEGNTCFAFVAWKCSSVKISVESSCEWQVQWEKILVAVFKNAYWEVLTPSKCSSIIVAVFRCCRL